MVTDKKHIHQYSKEELSSRVYEILDTVSDPEVPVLSVLDLGIVRDLVVSVNDNSPLISIAVTPTYTGCPAIDVMKMNIRMALLQAGFTDINITEILSPAWTTDWMTEAGKQKLKAYGIAPPQYRRAVAHIDAFAEEDVMACPLCNSVNTRLVSQFGSTACKALYKCEECREPFDYFKCH